MERVCVYLRVSTSQQDQHDLSIPDQRQAIAAFAEARDWEIVAEFREGGASARSDQRPVFQDMIAQALCKPPPFTRIIVHSMSRIFRDEMYYEWYRRKLEENGVTIVSITQDFGEGPGANLTRRVMALIDEMNSEETAKHVRRTMLANAKHNFWNGSVAPLGYASVVAEVRGKKHKKRLAIDEAGAETIRLIYRLYLEGDGTSGPLGTKSICRYLNDRGYRTPRGNPFHVSFVSKLLKDEVYVGRSWYNVKDSRTGKIRPKEEWIAISVPAIIDETDFQRVQTQLALRSPKVTAPRLVNSPVLLTGLAKCGACGARMRRDTSKGGKYHYYRCSNKIRSGGTPTCPASSIGAGLLDRIVISKLSESLLTAERVESIVAEVAEQRAAGNDSVLRSLGQLRDQERKGRKRLSNLMNALADGVVEASDTFRETVRQAEEEVERIAAVIADHERIIAARVLAISSQQAEVVAAQLREKLAESSPAIRKRIVRSFVSEVHVTDQEIAIIGAKSDLAEIVTGSLKP